MKMSIVGLIILIVLSLFACYCMIGRKGRGASNYVIRNIIGVYVLILGILAILKSNLGMVQGFYLGIVALIIALLTLFVFKHDYKKCRYLNLIGIIVGFIAINFAYVR